PAEIADTLRHTSSAAPLQRSGVPFIRPGAHARPLDPWGRGAASKGCSDWPAVPDLTAPALRRIGSRGAVRGGPGDGAERPPRGNVDVGGRPDRRAQHDVPAAPRRSAL